MESKRVQLVPKRDPKFRAKQEFREECNINTIRNRMADGMSPPAWMTSKTPYYGDFSSMPQSLTEAYNVINRAEEAFESLPMGFRQALDHDPRKLDSAPRELWEKFGLVRKVKTESTDDGTPSPRGAVSPEGAGDPRSPASEPRSSHKGASKQGGARGGAPATPSAEET